MDKQDQLKLLLSSAHDLALYTGQFIKAIEEGNNRRAHTKMIYVKIELQNFTKYEDKYKSTDMEG